MAVAITFTAPIEFLVDLKAAARAQDISKSKLLRDAFYSYRGGRQRDVYADESFTDTPDDFDPYNSALTEAATV
jgi:hypothetical protein